MNIWIVRLGDDIFEYSKFIKTDSLFEINSKLKTFDFSDVSQKGTHILNGNDMSLLRTIGGTVIFKEEHDWIINYLVDIDFNGDVDNKGEEIFFKFSDIRKSVLRDIKIGEII